MKLYEGKALMYNSHAPRKNLNIPEAILPALDDSPVTDPAVLDDPFYLTPEELHVENLPLSTSPQRSC